MDFVRCRQIPSAWIAVLALMAMALLPMLSQALMHARGTTTTWAEVCTPQGMRLVAFPSDEAADGDAPLQAAGHLQHCAFCTLGHDTPALPAALAPTLPVRAASMVLPWIFLHGPYTLHAWRSAQPRGPPSVS